MWYKIRHFAGKIEDLAAGLDTRQWALLAVVCVLVGFFCMKGHVERHR